MTNKQNLETEIKLYVPDHEAIAARLVAAGAECVVKRVFERNVRYEDAQHDFTERGVVLRVRYDTHARLTYKEPVEQDDDTVHKRFEAEVEVSDFDTMLTILKKLGYQQAVIYEKHRTTYELDGAEIVLDEMPYGNFMEIEGEAETINALIERLALGDRPSFRTNYLKLFEHVKQDHNLTFNDLTFDNFEAVTVGDDYFENLQI
jgi:adenylate cyclase, class 2